MCQIPNFLLCKRLAAGDLECFEPFMQYFITPPWANLDRTWINFEKEVAKIEALRLSIWQLSGKALKVKDYFPEFNNFSEEVKTLVIDLSPTTSDLEYFAGKFSRPHVQFIETHVRYPKGFNNPAQPFVDIKIPKGGVNFRERTFIAKNGSGAPAIDAFSSELRLYGTTDRLWLLIQNKHTELKGKLTLQEITGNWTALQTLLADFKDAPKHDIVGIISNRELAQDVTVEVLPQNYFVVHKGNLERHFSATFAKRFEGFHNNDALPERELLTRKSKNQNSERRDQKSKVRNQSSSPSFLSFFHPQRPFRDLEESRKVL